jgi:hypothetical protein
LQRYNKKSKTQVIYAIIHKNNVKRIKNSLKKRVSRGVLLGGFFAENEIKIEANCSKKADKIAAKNAIKFHKKEEK